MKRALGCIKRHASFTFSPALSCSTSPALFLGKSLCITWSSNLLWSKSDGVAQLPELRKASCIVVSSKILIGLLVAQDMIESDQDTVRDRHSPLELAMMAVLGVEATVFAM